jgi:hypothetical protein
MPGKRPIKKGSFGSHFDEVVKHFPHEEAPGSDSLHERDKPARDDGDVHDKLFASGVAQGARAPLWPLGLGGYLAKSGDGRRVGDDLDVSPAVQNADALAL